MESAILSFVTALADKEEEIQRLRKALTKIIHEVRSGATDHEVLLIAREALGGGE